MYTTRKPGCAVCSLCFCCWSAASHQQSQSGAVANQPCAVTLLPQHLAALSAWVGPAHAVCTPAVGPPPPLSAAAVAVAAAVAAAAALQYPSHHDVLSPANVNIVVVGAEHGGLSCAAILSTMGSRSVMGAVLGRTVCYNEAPEGPSQPHADSGTPSTSRQSNHRLLFPSSRQRDHLQHTRIATCGTQQPTNRRMLGAGAHTQSMCMSPAKQACLSTHTSMCMSLPSKPSCPCTHPCACPLLSKPACTLLASCTGGGAGGSLCCWRRSSLLVTP